MKEAFSRSQTGTYTVSSRNNINGTDGHYYSSLALSGRMGTVLQLVLCQERGEGESVTCGFRESWIGSGVTVQRR